METLYKKKKDQKRTYLMMIMQFFFLIFNDRFLSVIPSLYKGIYCEYLFELHWQVSAIQMCTHSICFYKLVDKKYSGCYLKTTELLDCALIGVFAVFKSNAVSTFSLELSMKNDQ